MAHGYLLFSVNINICLCQVLADKIPWLWPRFGATFIGVLCQLSHAYLCVFGQFIQAPCT